jgi:ATP-dependent DNA ligase
MVRRDGGGIRVLTRKGYDWSGRYPLISDAANALKAPSFLIDGEAVVCDDRGLAMFERLRGRRYDAIVFLSPSTC